MYKKERTSPFTSFEEVALYHNRELIPCLECGKPLQFLPRHVWFVHGLSVPSLYTERTPGVAVEQSGRTPAMEFRSHQ